MKISRIRLKNLDVALGNMLKIWGGQVRMCGTRIV